MDSAAGPPPYRVLARSYRPTRLSELVGQEALVRTLTSALRSGRVAHAFLLSGIRGVGKTTTARILARALNCTGPHGDGEPTPEPCGVCASCRSIAEDRSLDVIEMDAASHTGKGDVLELLEGVQFAPAASRYKIYILDEVHMLSEKAWNALLKTVEEPPPHAKFVFATTEVRKVPITVLSRCQRFDLRRVEPARLREHLRAIATREDIRADEQALLLIASAAEGSVRDALSLLDQAIALADGAVTTALVQDMLGLADRARVLELLEAALDGQPDTALGLFDQLYGLGVDPIQLVHDLLAFTQQASRVSVGAATGDTTHGPEIAARLGSLAARTGLPKLARAWQVLLKGLDEVRTAPDAAASLEMLLLRLAAMADLPPPGELVRLLRDGADEPPAMEPAAPPQRERAVPPPTPVAELRSVPRASPPELPNDFAELVSGLRSSGESLLASWLFEGAHVTRFEIGRIEFRPAPGLPGDITARLAEAALRLTGVRWLVATSREAGAPTLAELAAEEQRAKVAAARSDPQLQPVLEAYPGAEIVEVRLRSAQVNGSSGGTPE